MDPASMLSFVRFHFAFTIGSHILLVSTSIATIMLLRVGNGLGLKRFVSVAELYSGHFLAGRPYPAEALADATKVFAVDEMAQDVVRKA